MRNWILLYLIIGLVLLSCSNSTKINEVDSESVHYFDFDEVIHYHTDLIYLKEFETVDTSFDFEKYAIKVFHTGYPRSLQNLGFFDTLLLMGYEKINVPQSKNEALNDVFKEKEVDKSLLHFMCMPEYRDILIFKKQNQPVGIAKICFSCHILAVTGTSANTENFGASSGFLKLHEILFDE